VTDEAIIMCAPSDWPGVIGSKIAKCGDGCGAEIQIAPTGQMIVENQGAIPICLKCGKKRMRENDDHEIQPPTREQMEEIIRALADDARNN
jgi:hypothetical protein